METYEYLIFPGAIFITGVIIYFLLRVSPQKLEQLHGDVQIGKIDKQALISLSKRKRSHIQKWIFFSTFLCTVTTLLMSALFIKYFYITIVNFIICLIIQLCLLLLLGAYFYKKCVLLLSKR